MATPDDFKKIYDFTQKWEGGAKFTNNSKDPGGATKFGVSLRFLKNLPLKWSDTNKDSKVTWQDVFALEPKNVESIFKEYFWKPVKADNLPDVIAMIMFDGAVNIGVNRISRMLQHLVGVTEDGQIGNKTLYAVDRHDVLLLAKGLLRLRSEYYYMLARETLWADAFIKGWINRTKALADMLEIKHTDFLP